MSLRSALSYVPNTARNGHVLPSAPFGRGVLHLDLSLRFSVACLCGPVSGANLEAIMSKSPKPKLSRAEATKRNNRKIHARKFLATPEGKAWLERKLNEEAEMKLVSEARKFL